MKSEEISAVEHGPRRYEVELPASVTTATSFVGHRPVRSSPSADGKDVSADEHVVMVSDSDEMSSTEDSVRVGPERGWQEGIRIARGGTMERNFSGDVDETGGIREHIEGAQNREHHLHELQPARILIERLNRDGAAWGHPRKDDAVQERGVDCVAISGTDGSELLIQVTTPERRMWAELRKSPVDREQSDPSVPAEEIRRAIYAKKTRAGKNIVLALDATDIASYAFRVVVDKFRGDHSPWVSGVGFASVWLVGPTSDTTYRLDAP